MKALAPLQRYPLLNNTAGEGGPLSFPRYLEDTGRLEVRVQSSSCSERESEPPGVIKRSGKEYQWKAEGST